MEKLTDLEDEATDIIIGLMDRIEAIEVDYGIDCYTHSNLILQADDWLKKTEGVRNNG